MMMRLLEKLSKISIILLLLFFGCNKNEEKKINGIVTTILPSDIEGTDSVMIVSYEADTLFAIATGGNMEFLNDTVISKYHGGKAHLFQLADYFQNDQILYVLYDPETKEIMQSERLYLPYIGLDITRYSALDSITVTADSIKLSAKTGEIHEVTLALQPLTLGEGRIINFYEYH